MYAMLRLLGLLILLGTLGGCETLQSGSQVTDQEIISGIAMIIESFGPYPCTYARSTRLEFTPAGSAYYRVVCYTAHGDALYTARHNPYAPRGTASSWIVQRAAY